MRYRWKYLLMWSFVLLEEHICVFLHYYSGWKRKMSRRQCDSTLKNVLTVFFSSTFCSGHFHYLGKDRARWWGRCHQWLYLPPLHPPKPPESLGGLPARSHGSVPAATHPPDFLILATPTGKTGACFTHCNRDVRRFMQHCGTRWNCAACIWYTMHLCYCAICISQLCQQHICRENKLWEQWNISQPTSEMFL